jgi:hypothetical protein
MIEKRDFFWVNMAQYQDKKKLDKKETFETEELQI